MSDGTEEKCPHPPKGTSGYHHFRPEYRMVKGEVVGSMVCAYCGAKPVGNPDTETPTATR